MRKPRHIIRIPSRYSGVACAEMGGAVPPVLPGITRRLVRCQSDDVLKARRAQEVGTSFFHLLPFSQLSSFFKIPLNSFGVLTDAPERLGAT